MKTLTKKRIFFSVLTLVVTALVMMGLYYVFLPALTFRSGGLWEFIFCVLMLFAGDTCIFFYSPMLLAIDHYADNRKEEYLYEEKIKNQMIIVIGIVIAFVVIAIIASVPSWTIIRANDYSNLIEVIEGDFSEDISEFSNVDCVIVDQKVAQHLGDRILGTIPNASYYEVNDEYNLVKVKGEYYRLSPIDYGKNIFKYHLAKTNGIPGYIMVNANTQEIEFVELKESMKYSPSAFFGNDLKRHIRFNYSKNYILGESYFEVDEDLNPYWITSVKTPKVGIADGLVTTSVLVTNAVTGEIVEYSIDELPEWIDHVSELKYLMNLLEDHYWYSEGWYNPSKTNRFRTSYHYRTKKSGEYTPFDGYNSIVANDGEIYFTTGLTPANAAETNVAILLINPRTGEVKSYNVTGAEESSAQAAAEGLVQNLNYSASFPIITNVDGMPTYFMLLKDNAGLVQRYALCNIEQYSKVVQAETLDDVITAYREKMGVEYENSSLSQETTLIEENDMKKMTGEITKVVSVEIGGDTHFFFYIEGSEVMFDSSIQVSFLQPLKVMVGQNVEIEYYDSPEQFGVGVVTKIIFSD